VPAGEYEIFNYDISTTVAIGGMYTSDVVRSLGPPGKISVRFEVKPGRTSYIGSFTCTLRDGSALFVVADKADRDVPIAKRKKPELVQVINSTPDLKIQNIPGFVGELSQ
jgi:hypothetical protein